MSLFTLDLPDGREVKMIDFQASATYAGLIEGYPCARLNDAILKRACRTDRTDPAAGIVPLHLIEPTRAYPEGESGSRPFGPLELLPAVTCRATFVSAPVEDHHDRVLYRSWLTVAWFQPDITAPLNASVGAVLADLSWDALAEDQEL